MATLSSPEMESKQLCSFTNLFKPDIFGISFERFKLYFFSSSILPGNCNLFYYTIYALPLSKKELANR